MDKLRSLQYFVTAADTSSFSAAARRLGVSVAAVAKMVTALERELGTLLFQRTARGLVLTAAGGSYLESCVPALEQLRAADEKVGSSASRPRGTVVVGVQPVIAQECLTAALPRFAAMHPEIQLDVRYFMRATDEQLRGVDVFLAMGWPQAVGTSCCGRWAQPASSCALLPPTGLPTGCRAIRASSSGTIACASARTPDR